MASETGRRNSQPAVSCRTYSKRQWVDMVTFERSEKVKYKNLPEELSYYSWMCHNAPQ